MTTDKAELLALFDDLFDLVRNFGAPSQATGTMSIAVTTPRELAVTISAAFMERQMIVVGSHRVMHPHGGNAYVLTPDGRASALVGPDVTLDDLRAFVAHVDRMMGPRGGFDRRGERQRDQVPYELSTALFSRSVEAAFGTDDAFNGPEQLIPLPEGISTAYLDAIVAMFDRPEELTTYVDYFRSTYLCRRGLVPELEKSDVAMSRMCLKLGITSEDQLVRTPKAVLDRAWAEIMRELDKKPPN